MQKANNLQEAAQYIYQLQLKATKEDKTFAISGLLLDPKASIVYAGNNRVLVTIEKMGREFVIDPTSHCEQRLIYWYFANREKLALPPPNQLTIITSLDPCIMCASSILLCGFNVGTISLDSFGGINYNSNCFQDYHFAPHLQHKLIDTFGYYKVSGVQCRSKYQFKAEKVVFKEDEMSKELQELIAGEFLNTVKNYNGIFTGAIAADKVKNLQHLPQDDELIKDLKLFSPEALTNTMSQRVNAGSYYYRPNKALKNMLQHLVASTPMAKNAIAIIDPNGNLLLARADRFDVSPVHTAIVSASKDYSLFCFEQFEKASHSQGRFILVSSFLAPLTRCTFIFLNALPGDEAVSLQAAGVLAFIHNCYMQKGGFQYINDYQNTVTVTLQKAITHLAPEYNEKCYNVIPMLAELSD